MPALSAHWDLSKRQASLMAILLQPGTRLRGGQTTDFVLLNLTALSRRAAQIRGEPSMKVLEKLCAGWYAKVFAKVGCMGHQKRGRAQLWVNLELANFLWLTCPIRPRFRHVRLRISTHERPDVYGGRS